MAKIASQAQWGDLANRVKAKQDQLSAGTGIDSTQLAANTVGIDGTVVVYEQPGVTPSNPAYVGTSNIVDGAVTTAKLANGAVTAGKIDLTSSVDADGWTKVQLSSNLVAYFKKGTTSRTQGGNSWGSFTASVKPTDLDTTHTFFGAAGGTASDSAINVSGSASAGVVTIQVQNAYTGSVTANVYWWAQIFEFLS